MNDSAHHITLQTPSRKSAVVDLSLIIVNYNVRGFLEALLRSIDQARDGLNIEVIVVDNHSTDGSIEMMRCQFPDVRLIANPDNRGFAAANNQALRMYRGRYACLVNPDVLLQEDTLSTMAQFMDAQPDVGAAGCKVLNPDGSLQPACRRSVPTPLTALCKLTGLSWLFPKNRIMGAYNLTYLDPETTHDVDAVSGSFMVVRREAIDQTGLLDESFFMYGEDLDWLYRMRQNGWRVCYVPATRIVHYKGESSKQSGRRMGVEFYRAMYIFARKHRPTHGARLLTAPISWLVTLGIVSKGLLSLARQMLQRAAIPLIDLACVNITPLIATLIRVGKLTPLTGDTLLPYIVIHGAYSVVWMGCFYLSGLYGQRRYSIPTAVLAVTTGFLIIAALTYFTPAYAFSRAVVLLSWVLNLIAVAGWRWGISRNIGAKRRVVVIGTDDIGRSFVSRLQSEPRSGYDVIGFLDSNSHTIGTAIQGACVLNDNGQLMDTVDTYRVDEIIVSASAMSYQEILHLVSSCTRLGVGLKLVADAGLPGSEQLDTMQLVELRSDPLAQCRKVMRRVWKGK